MQCSNNLLRWAVVVAQLAERLLPHQRSTVWIQPLAKFTFNICLLYWKDENIEKEALDGQFFNNNLLRNRVPEEIEFSSRKVPKKWNLVLKKFSRSCFGQVLSVALSSNWSQHRNKGEKSEILQIKNYTFGIVSELSSILQISCY